MTSSSERSEPGRRERRRRRDDLAERRALLVILALFLSFGGLGYAALNFGGSSGFDGGRPEASGSGEHSDPRRPASATEKTLKGASGTASRPIGAAAGRAAPPTRAQPERRASSSLDETPDLPALGHIQQSGLTAGAEGIPKVETQASGQEARAGIETCRFAYGVWEFSPNQTFRFLTTCRGLGRLELVGAYEVRGAEVHLSPLSAGDVRWTSVFEVERPSTMRSRVVLEDVELTVTQRVTVVRAGLHGEAFRDAFRRRNQLLVPPLPREGASSPPSREKSKLEELLGG